MYDEDDLLPLSALQHILFCERQCALIHIEQLWVENMFTAQGRIMHERVDRSGGESRGDIRIEFALPLRSLRLGLIGKADAVEFHRQSEGNPAWLPFPVEHKRGRPKKDNCDKVQLCAQALCLEETLSLTIPQGALFYGKNRRRQLVEFDEVLRR
ncbi:CRISPR-associated RecB family exonuclease Cas4 [hydrothermal vent metagenome]|uniref:5' to 3' exodeoxyribonuclease (nucleoside 3'-phosphate-forming) n=1 Tax=hydrothermal vent metagenome TaxID=652676 RepID=A0A3B0USS5_9ZZZZ